MIWPYIIRHKLGSIYLQILHIDLKICLFKFPGGPYSAFAGKDATRGLATEKVAASETEYDDCSDLTPDEIASAKEWEDQFRGNVYVINSRSLHKARNID